MSVTRPERERGEQRGADDQGIFCEVNQPLRVRLGCEPLVAHPLEEPGRARCVSILSFSGAIPNIERESSRYRLEKEIQSVLRNLRSAGAKVVGAKRAYPLRSEAIPFKRAAMYRCCASLALRAESGLQ